MECASPARAGAVGPELPVEGTLTDTGSAAPPTYIHSYLSTEP